MPLNTVDQSYVMLVTQTNTETIAQKSNNNMYYV